MKDLQVVHMLPSGTRQYRMHGWIAINSDICVGHVHMQMEANSRIKFLDAWVHEGYRRQGIFRILWNARWEYVNKHFKGYIAYAWAKPTRLPLLLEKGFTAGDTTVYVDKEI